MNQHHRVGHMCSRRNLNESCVDSLVLMVFSGLQCSCSCPSGHANAHVLQLKWKQRECSQLRTRQDCQARACDEGSNCNQLPCIHNSSSDCLGMTVTEHWVSGFGKVLPMVSTSNAWPAGGSSSWRGCLPLPITRSKASCTNQSCLPWLQNTY